MAVFVGLVVAAFMALPVAKAQGIFVHGAVVALEGTPHLWIADEQGVLHWGGDTRALAGRHVNWGARTEVSLEGLRALPVGDPWLSAGLLKDGDPIYLVKWETEWSQPRLLHIQSIADVELFGINGDNYGNLVLDTATWEARYGMSVASLQRGVLPAAVPSAPTMASTPAPAPAPTPAPTLPDHPDAVLVRDTAIARGAPADVAVQIAADVIGRGAVQAFLHGTDAGALYGVADCQWRSPQCPLAPETPASPRDAAAALVDPALMPALDLLTAVFDARDLDGDLYTFVLIDDLRMTVTFESLPAGNDAGFRWVGDRARPPRLVVSDAYRSERDRALVSLLAHELWHALTYANGRIRTTHAACIAEEVNAERAAAWGWSAVRPGSGARLTFLEQQAEWTYQHWIAGTLEENVRDRYWASCAA